MKKIYEYSRLPPDPLIPGGFLLAPLDIHAIIISARISLCQRVLSFSCALRRTPKRTLRAIQNMNKIIQLCWLIWFRCFLILCLSCWFRAYFVLCHFLSVYAVMSTGVPAEAGIPVRGDSPPSSPRRARRFNRRLLLTASPTLVLTT